MILTGHRRDLQRRTMLRFGALGNEHARRFRRLGERLVRRLGWHVGELIVALLQFKRASVFDSLTKELRFVFFKCSPSSFFGCSGTGSVGVSELLLLLDIGVQLSLLISRSKVRGFFRSECVSLGWCWIVEIVLSLTDLLLCSEVSLVILVLGPRQAGRGLP